MDKIYLDKVNSTQIYLKNYIKENGYKQPISVIAQNQTDGIGSRNNKWNGKNGNLFFSFVLDKNKLPKDLPLQSASIYFSFILKDLLSKKGSLVLLKWPNDFYIKNKKIGGTITSLKNELLYCGIGLNLIEFNSNFGYLDININIDEILNEYFDILETYPLWKQIFMKYEVDFQKNNCFKTNLDGSKILLKDTILQKDGSILIDKKKVFSLR